jgi:protein SCO1/2
MVNAQYNLIDHHGNPVDNATYRGKYQLVFFGFTNCRVVCPRALGRLSSVLDRLGPAAERFQPLYVTVDPERDTPAAMKKFLEERYPRFTGLTGNAEQTEAAQENFRVFARRAADPSGRDEYVIPHSAITYVLDRSGAFLTHFTDIVDEDTLVARLTDIPLS